MDVADFAEWVAGTARLTSSQRREAFRSLALAEAMASLDDEAFEDWGCAIEDGGHGSELHDHAGVGGLSGAPRTAEPEGFGWVPWLKSATVGSSAWGVHTAQIGT